MGEHRPIMEDGFWAGKTPCWVMRGCIFEARHLCRAYQDQSLPCWEQKTLCKELLSIDTCFACQVFKEYGSAPGETDNRTDMPSEYPVGSR